MKKYNLLKILGISFLVMVLLTWLIPIGNYGTTAVEIGSILPLGLFDLFYIPFFIMLDYAEYGLIILMIGALYGVLNKTGAYSKIVDEITIKFKNKKKNFLIISILTFSIISSFTGLVFPLLIFAPLFITVILKLGYNKITALAATIGAILVGLIGTTLGLNTTVYKSAVYAMNLFKLLGLDLFDKFISRLLILIIVVFLYCITVVAKAKSETKKSNIEIPLYEENKLAKKTVWPLVILLALLFLTTIFLMYNWDYITTTETFANFYTNLTELTVGSISLYSSILGNSLTIIGSFGNIQLIAIIFIFILLISWIYSVKFNEIIDGMKNGMKSMLKVAFYVVLANVIMSIVMSVSTGSVVITITNYIDELFTGFNVVGSTLIGIVGGLFYNNFCDFIIDNYGLIYNFSGNEFLAVLAISFQSIFNIMMLILPTSLVLVAGLSYLDVNYKDWIKYIWKYVLQIFVIVIIIAQIVYMLY